MAPQKYKTENSTRVSNAVIPVDRIRASHITLLRLLPILTPTSTEASYVALRRWYHY